MKLLAGLVGLSAAANTSDKPNILFIFTDDQGYSDVGWKNRQVRTPNLDMIRKDGLTIEGGYSQSRCTPSRVALMTGRYPFNIGFQKDHVIEVTNAAGIPLEHKLLPEYLKDAGYDTHFIGKWHLGYCLEDLRPEKRGFDTSYGFMGAGIDYWSHDTRFANDYWDNGVQSSDVGSNSGTYSTDDFAQQAINMLDQRITDNDTDPFYTWLSFNVPHSPVTAPTEAELNSFSDVNNAERREYLAALWRMDYQVGRVVDKLKESGEYDNTLIIFQSDNGPTGQGRNYPLRGYKGTYLEGGMRVPSFITGPGIMPGTLDRMTFMHISDWAPTLIDFAGVDPAVANPDFDGHSFKDVLTSGADTPRSDMMYFVNPKPAGGVYREGKWKLAWKQYNKYQSMNHTLPSEGACVYSGLIEEGSYTLDEIDTYSGNLQLADHDGQEILLFDLEADPYELVNVYDSSTHFDIVDSMMNTISTKAREIRNSIGQINLSDSEGDTASANYVLTTGFTTSGWCSEADLAPEEY